MEDKIKYIDEENGAKFSLYDTFYYFDKRNNVIHDAFIDNDFTDDDFKDSEDESKAYLNKKECEIALCKFLLAKNNMGWLFEKYTPINIRFEGKPEITDCIPVSRTKDDDWIYQFVKHKYPDAIVWDW